MMTKDTNTGHRNTGDRNTGYYNTGDYNTGSWNTGDYNTGSWNTGAYNTGYRNTGSWNTGSWNTGSWNTGSWNTGYCNTVTPDDCLIFNKPGRRSEWDAADKPSWMFVDLTCWVPEGEMSDAEKRANPSYVTTGGYLKAYATLQDAWREAWGKASAEDRAKTLKLPNFDIDVFEEIFGFRPEMPGTKRTFTRELTEDQIARVEAALAGE